MAWLDMAGHGMWSLLWTDCAVLSHPTNDACSCWYKGKTCIDVRWVRLRQQFAEVRQARHHCTLGWSCLQAARINVWKSYPHHHHDQHAWSSPTKSLMIIIIDDSSLFQLMCSRNCWWYLLVYGYGSIPINTIFSGMNIHLPAILGFTRGTRVLTHCHIRGMRTTCRRSPPWGIKCGSEPRHR